MDPFYIVKDEIQNSIKSAEALFIQYTSSGSKSAVQELDSCIQAVYLDLDDLRESVKAAESAPGDFGLTSSDIKQRKKFIEDTQRITDELKKNLTTKKAEVDRLALFRAPQQGARQQQPSTQQLKPSSNSQFIEHEKQQQTQLLRQQDNQLDEVKNTVFTLKEVASVMGRELEDQSKLLEEMEIQVDTTQDKLGAGLKRVNEFLKDNATFLPFTLSTPTPNLVANKSAALPCFMAESASSVIIDAVENCNKDFPAQGCGAKCQFPCPIGFYCLKSSDCAESLSCEEGMCDTKSTYIPDRDPINIETKTLVSPTRTSMAVQTAISPVPTGVIFGILGSPCLASVQCTSQLVCFDGFCQNSWTQPKFGAGREFFESEWNILKYAYGKDNQGLVIDPITGNDKVLSVFYAKGTANPGMKPAGGLGIYARPMPLVNSRQVTLEYSVLFERGFDWVLGGKLPGLYGGHPGCTGGNDAKDCYSARFMWRAEGKAEIYLYVDTSIQVAGFCDKIPNSYCNPKFGMSVARGAFSFSSTSWTTVRQTIRMNSFTNGVPNHDGTMKVWVNNNAVPIISMDKVIFGAIESANTQGIGFETFFGGSSPSFLNNKDQHTYYKDFRMYSF